MDSHLILSIAALVASIIALVGNIMVYIQVERNYQERKRLITHINSVPDATDTAGVEPETSSEDTRADRLDG